MPVHVDDRRLRTIGEAAQYLRVSDYTIRHLGRTGRLELIKVGRSTRVTPWSLENHIRNAKRMIPKRN